LSRLTIEFALDSNQGVKELVSDVGEDGGGQAEASQGEQNLPERLRLALPARSLAAARPERPDHEEHADDEDSEHADQDVLPDQLYVQMVRPTTAAGRRVRPARERDERDQGDERRCERQGLPRRHAEKLDDGRPNK